MWQKMLQTGSGGIPTISNLIPFNMTANSQNGYNATSSSNFESYQPYMAFNNDVNTTWAQKGQIEKGWLKIQFPYPVTVKRIVLKAKSGEGNVRVTKFQASPNGAFSGEETTLGTYNFGGVPTLTNVDKLIENNITAYAYYRLYMPNSGSYDNVPIWQMYGY